MSSRRTSGWWLILASLLLVAAIGGGGWVLFDRYVRPPPSPVAPMVASLPSPVEEPIGEAVVVAVEGAVERSTDGGPWSSLQKGERLRANDAIRTGANAKAELEVDKNSSVVLTSGSEVGIREISRAVHRFKLTRGQLKADYREDGDARAADRGQRRRGEDRGREVQRPRRGRLVRGRHRDRQGEPRGGR